MNTPMHIPSTRRRLARVGLAGALMLALVAGSGTAWAENHAYEETGGSEDAATAIFAGGCFWCVEADFDKLDGVLSTESGYTGGTVPEVTYDQVTAGGTGHREAVRISFDPQRIGYTELLDHFWRTVDPTDDGGQFCDRGESYTTAIFALDERQRELAEASKESIEASNALSRPIVTPILDAGAFYPAESYHQDYYRKNPIRYRFYRTTCGRDARLNELWGKSS